MNTECRPSSTQKWFNFRGRYGMTGTSMTNNSNREIGRCCMIPDIRISRGS